MCMLFACKNAQTLEALSLELILWQHTLDRFFDDSLWEFRTNFCECRVFDSSWETAVAVVNFIGFFVSSYNRFGCVDNYDVVTAIHVWRVGRLVFAGQVRRDLRCQATKWQL